MTDKPKGGRGKVAPYRTTICRVPEPLVPQIESLVGLYRDIALNKGLTRADLVHLDSDKFNYSLKSKGEAILGAKKILKGKKSARQSLVKLLQVLYNDETIELENL